MSTAVKSIGIATAELQALDDFARQLELVVKLETARKTVALGSVDLSLKTSKASQELANVATKAGEAGVQAHKEWREAAEDHLQALRRVSGQYEKTLMAQRDLKVAPDPAKVQEAATTKLQPTPAENQNGSTIADPGKDKAGGAEADAKKALEKMDELFRKGFADTLLGGSDAWRKFTKSLGASFKDSVTTELRKGLDEVYKLVAKPIVTPVLTNFQGAIGGIVDVLKSGGASAGGVASLAGTVSAAWDLVSNGFNVAAGMGKGLVGSDLLKKFGSESVTKLVGDFGAGMQSTASWSGFSNAFQAGGTQMAGAIAGSVLNGFAGYGLSKALSGGYSAGGWVNTAAGIASAIPGIGPIAGVIGGVVNRAFGRKLKDQGLEGVFGGEAAFTGNTYQFYKGGWLRSDKTKRGELDEPTRNGLAEQFNAMRLATGAMAQVLGLGTAAVDGFTSSIKVSFNGLDEAAVQKRLGEEFDKVAEALAAATLGTTAYTRAGETSVQAIARLSGGLGIVNDVLGNLNSTLYTSSLAGADAAASLVDLFGNTDTFKTATGAYFKNFYSAQEQRDAARGELSRQLGAVNLQLPDVDAGNARAQWRALADAQNLSTEEGRKAWSVLVKLSDAFAGLTQSVEGVAKAAEDMAQAAVMASEGLRASLINLEGRFEGGGLSRTYQAQDAALTVSSLLDSVGLGQDVDVLVGKILGATTGDVERYFREMWELLDTTQARQQLVSVTEALMGLAKVSDTVEQTPVESDADGLATRRLAFRSQLGTAMESARLQTLTAGEQASYLRNKEGALWVQLDTAQDPLAIAEQLQQTLLERIGLEARLRADVDASTLSGLQKQLSVAQSLRGAAEGMQRTADGLRTGAASALNPYTQLQYVAGKFDDAYARASAGDVNAWQDVQSFGQSYVQLSRDNYASSTDAADVFFKVTRAMDELASMGNAATPEITALNTQIELLQSVGENTDQSRWTAQQQLDAFQRLDEVMRQQQGQQQTSADKQVELLQLQITELRRANDLKDAELGQRAAIETRQMALMERQAGDLAALRDSARMQEAVA